MSGAKGHYYAPPLERIVAKTIFVDECWRFTGCLSDGYGNIGHQGKNLYVHRFSYEEFVGPIPAGLTIDHLCHQPPCPGGKECPHRSCWNPAHLEAVTNGENVMRGMSPIAQASRRDHCINGHPWTPENTYVYPSNGVRSCRACNREYQARRRAAARVEPRAYVVPPTCRKGHELTPDAVRLRPWFYECKECCRLRAAKRRALQQEEAVA